ncbi:metallophosphoesterase [Desulfosarcina ovata subsp. sediminis]|uniref:Metallophosphoesterase n=1 Tax=Desulfosarcina ovata subsp. sediminis TaxID=885957 RepID=A0A5K7ZHN5_9BACT|nr:DNA repair exonuclease [Desulfosarcina ovata]BBO81718.1 metallophosphoesterase [Desulfosarcina ovata subsp. sediminis]
MDSRGPVILNLKMKFIHTADIHLDSPLHRLEAYDGAPVEEIRQASRRALENLINLALDEAVDFVLIAGDLFDGDWRDYNTGLYFTSRMRRLNEAGIFVFIVQGNHDAAGQMTRSLPLPPNVHIFPSARPETRMIDALKVAVHGQSFSRAAVTENLAAGYPAPVAGHVNIGLLHTSLTGRPGHENYAPCALEDLVNKGYDYWALGHVHQAEIVTHDPPVVFPGCVQGRHVREGGEKGCMLVVMEEGAAPLIHHQTIDVIRWTRTVVDLTGANTIDEVLDRFREEFEKTVARNEPLPVIARIELAGRTELHTRILADVEYIKQALRSTAAVAFGDRAWIEKIQVNTRPVRGRVPDSGPINELNLLVERLSSSPDDLQALGDELAPLFQKLPADYRQNAASFRPDDPEAMARLLAQAHALLVQRLRKASGAT